MVTGSIVLGLAIIAVLSSIVVSIVQARQQAEKKRLARVASLLQKSIELEGLAAPLPPLVSSTKIIEIIYRELFHVLDQAIECSRGDATLIKRKNDEQGQLAKLIAETEKSTIEHAESDTELSQHQQHLANTVYWLQAAARQGKVSKAEEKSLVDELKLSRLNITANSHIKKAEQFRAQKDRMLAQRHYKHARDTLKKADFDVPDKADRIAELDSHIKSLNSADFAAN